MRRREYTILTIVISVLEAAAIVAIVLWLLPQWGIKIPIWGLILLMLAFGVYQVITYRLGRRALGRKPVVSPEAIVGSCGKASTKLAPNGYVKVKGELWQASSTGPNVDEGDEIVVVGVQRLTLFVAPISGSDERQGSQGKEDERHEKSTNGFDPWLFRKQTLFRPRRYRRSSRFRYRTLTSVGEVWL